MAATTASMSPAGGAVTARAGRRRMPVLMRRAALYVLVAGGALTTIYPLLWLVGSSFKPDNEIFTTINPIPDTFTLRNYVSGWTGTGTSFTVYLINSGIVALGAVLGNVVSCAMTAYAFARLDFRFRKLWFTLMLATLMLPFEATLIPQYTLFYRLGWVNTFLPLIVPRFLAESAFFIFLMVQFIRGIPRDLDEAAAIDGAGHLRIFWSIILPLMRPALVTTTVLTFIWTFNDFFRQLVYLSDNATYTVPLGLNSFLDKMSGTGYGGLLAMSVVSLLPTVAVFLFFQKRLVEGVATTGVKG